MNLVAVADAPDGRFATLDDAGTVSVWAGPGEPLSRFDAGPCTSIALTTGPGGTEIVTGSWTGGVAGFAPDGARRWWRRDLRHVHAVRALPEHDGTRRVAGVVLDRQGCLVLGRTGGTRLRVPDASFIAGWADGSLLVAGRDGTARRLARDGTPRWQAPLHSFAVLDAAVSDGALVSVAGRWLTHLTPAGAVAWRASTPVRESIPWVYPAPDGAGWRCLSTASSARTVPTVWRVTPDGVLTPLLEVPAPPGHWLGFAAGGTHLLGADGRLTDLGLAGS